ncbi:MAG: DPP IV N-terminal domain-containing protein, partial [Desulfobacterales bacterium]|nr:DPP IV N-terminal domain-containing protein [Desulfobacterales bacterium]
MNYQHKFSILSLSLSMLICVLMFNACSENPVDVFQASLDSTTITTSFNIVLPEDGASFPKNISSPEFEWEAGDNSVWLIKIDLPDGNTLKIGSKENSWVPEADVWEKIISSSENKYCQLTVFGHDGKVLSKSEEIRFRISPNEIDRFVIYRLAHYPIDFTNEKPSLYHRDVTQSKSEVFFKAKDFCFSCHVPSPDGKALAISSRRDVLKRDKNAKLTAMDILRIVLRRELTKNIKGVDLLFVDRKEDYVLVEDSEKNKQIWGSMMASWSPDNRYILLALNDGIAVSDYLTDTTVNLSYHLTGNIALYDVENKLLSPISGASEELIREFWPYFSPNGETISFSRNSETNDSDIYVVPFNNGKGGNPVPLKGASEKNIREYFQRYSPDGKWIIFNRVSG